MKIQYRKHVAIIIQILEEQKEKGKHNRYVYFSSSVIDPKGMHASSSSFSPLSFVFEMMKMKRADFKFFFFFFN